MQNQETLKFFTIVVRRKYLHGYLVKNNSQILPVILACLSYFGLFYLVLPYSSLLRLVKGCSTFYRKVKARKVRQNLETLKKVKAGKARKQIKARNERKKMKAC